MVWPGSNDGGIDMSVPAASTVQVENTRTHVTEWRFAPGAATGYHRHEFDYVVVPLTTGMLELIDRKGTKTWWSCTVDRRIFAAS